MSNTKGTILGSSHPPSREASGPGVRLPHHYPTYAYRNPLTTSIVTGANGGLGSAIARHIATSTELAAQYHGLYTVRPSSSSSLGASHELLSTLLGRKNLLPHTCDVLALDLASPRSVRDAAATINARVAARDLPPIRALVLNAGFQDFGKQQWVELGDGNNQDDGQGRGLIDVTFAANYLGHWLLVLLLLGSMDREHGRIVVVGSQAHECVPFLYPPPPLCPLFFSIKKKSPSGKTSALSCECPC